MGPGHQPCAESCTCKKHSGEPTYAPIRVALSDADMRSQVLKYALDELEAWEQRYAAYSELAGIFHAIAAYKKGA